MLPCVQKRVVEEYNSIEEFIDFHAAKSPEEFQNELSSRQIVGGAQPVEHWSMKPAKQREFMRELVKKHGSTRNTYAQLLRMLCVQDSWLEEQHVKLFGRKYADAVWRDGEIKGWLQG